MPKTSFQDVTSGLAGHNHQACVDEALAAAERVCRGHGARLTDLRRKVLELVWASHAPIGAYEILDRLDGANRRPAPPTIYRALDFLMAQGLVHRIQSLNAYVGCAHPEAEHEAQYLICEDCGDARELEIAGLSRRIREAAASEGFTVGGQTVEVRGKCGACREGSVAGAKH